MSIWLSRVTSPVRQRQAKGYATPSRSVLSKKRGSLNTPSLLCLYPCLYLEQKQAVKDTKPVSPAKSMTGVFSVETCARPPKCKFLIQAAVNSRFISTQCWPKNLFGLMDRQQ